MPLPRKTRTNRAGQTIFDAAPPETAAYVNDLIAAARDVHVPVDANCAGCVAAMTKIAHYVAHVPTEYRV